MCIRSVYYCQDCKTTFPIPLKSVQDSSWWKTLFCTNLSKDKQSLNDWLCDNKHCLRKTEHGYLACLEMHDHCWFCIRYGKTFECYNQYIYVPCPTCYKKNWLNSYNNEPYCFPLHFREINT